MIAIVLIIISLLAIGIYMLAEFRKVKHQIWAVIIIGLLLFGYLSFTWVLRGRDIDYGTASGLFEATKIYFLWIGSIFGNMRTITGNAVDMDWGVNESKVS
jgi:hypothetical protein